jgi:two-component system, OmpR family, sensor histidine kinase BaeS
VSEWQNLKEKKYLDYASEILTNNEVSVPAETPFFVYNNNKELVFTNRGMRKYDSNQNEVLPVYSDKRLIGYYFAGYMDIIKDESNIRFLNSLYSVFLTAVLLSFLIAFIISALLSKRLSSQAEKVSLCLKRISEGDYSFSVPEKGVREILQIAVSANELSRQLKKEQELRSQWAEDLAHDLRTPISAVIAQFEGMRDGVLDISGERIEKNLKEINRIKQLVYDIDELARLDSPEYKFNPDKINSEYILKELKEQFAFEAEKKKAEITYTSSVPVFTGDRHLLYRALANIVSNAVRHTNENGRIELSVEKVDKHILIKVFNTGDKIPDKEINKVFDRLYRGEFARNTPGTGLGLTIASKITKLHNGEIIIESDDNGTSVTVRFPHKM